MSFQSNATQMEKHLAQALVDLIQHYSEEIDSTIEALTDENDWNEYGQLIDEDVPYEDIPIIRNASTFEDVGMMTMNTGIVIRFSDGTSYTLELTRYR